MAIAELDVVFLTEDLPASGLKAGDTGWVIAVHAGGTACAVEFLTGSGNPISVETVPIRAVRKQSPRKTVSRITS